MSLLTLDLPSPKELRPGWAALSALYAARGWGEFVHAKPDLWNYHDGGGNWVSLRFLARDQAILIGHDHEYSDSYFGEAATYFGEPETNILAGAPEWWSFDMSGLTGDTGEWEWIGFVYGWDEQVWQRASYEVDDGFNSVGMLSAITVEGLKKFMDGRTVSETQLQALIDADCAIASAQLEAVYPDGDIDAGISAARAFLDAPV